MKSWPCDNLAYSTLPGVARLSRRRSSQDRAEVGPKDVRVRPSVGNCLLILRRYCGKEDHQLAEVEMFGRGKRPQGEMQHAQAIETGTGRATVVQLPVEFSLCGFLGHKIEQSDWRLAIEVHLRDREREEPRSCLRALGC